MKTSAAFNLHKRALRNSHRGLCYILNSWCGKLEYWWGLFHGTGDERKRDITTLLQNQFCLFVFTNSLQFLKEKLFVFNKPTIVFVLIWSGMLVRNNYNTQKTPMDICTSLLDKRMSVIKGAKSFRSTFLAWRFCLWCRCLLAIIYKNAVRGDLLQTNRQLKRFILPVMRDLLWQRISALKTIYLVSVVKMYLV